MTIFFSDWVGVSFPQMFAAYLEIKTLFCDRLCIRTSPSLSRASVRSGHTENRKDFWRKIRIEWTTKIGKDRASYGTCTPFSLTQRLLAHGHE
jgi:hypothetical protein